MACWWGKTPPPRHRSDVSHSQAWPYHPPVAVDGAALRRATQEYVSDADRRESTERQAHHRPKKATRVLFHTALTNASRRRSGGRHGSTPPQGTWSIPLGVTTTSPGARANHVMYASQGSWHLPRRRVATKWVNRASGLPPVWKSTSVSSAPDNSPLSHFSAMTWPRWLRRAVRNRDSHAIEPASRRWRGGRRGDSG